MKRMMIMFFVVILTGAVCFAEVPSSEEFASADSIVTDILAPKIDAMKSGATKPCEVAEYAVSLMGESETAAAKYLLAKQAYSFYMKGGDYAKAVEAIGMMRSEIPDMPDEKLLKAIAPAARGVPASKAPEIHAVLNDLQCRVKSHSEISKLKAQLKRAKASERYAIYRKLGEGYAVIGDWKGALENFAKCGDGVAKAAQGEIDGKESVAKLAGAWWDCSEEKGLLRSVSMAFRKHAAELYKKGLDGGTISGLAKKLAEQRIEEANSAVEAVAAPQKQGRQYCIVDLSPGPNAKRYSISYLSQPPVQPWSDEYKTTKMVLRRIEAGSFMMGGTGKVKISRSFWVGVFELTQKQWELVMGTRPWERNPIAGAGDSYPVYRISYDMIRGKNKGSLWPKSDDVDDDSFIGKLRARTRLHFDLTTEAQWEYACRAGTITAFGYGEDPNGEYMWYNANARGQTHPVGMKKPNNWGLYDMHGNVWERCLDYSGEYAYGTDPKGPIAKPGKMNRMARGGAWNKSASCCSSSFRDVGDKASDPCFRVGLRLACPAR